MGIELSHERGPTSPVVPMIWPNTMIFPQALREAIPELCNGRALQVDSIDGHASNTQLIGPRVQAKFVTRETGSLHGVYDIWLDLDTAAARLLAETLLRLSDEAERSA